MSKIWQLLVALGLSASALAACSSGSSTDASGNPTVRDQIECLYTYCDSIEQDCKVTSDNCWSTCATMEDYMAECAATCSNLDCGNCSAADQACAKRGYKATIVGPADAKLLSACQGAVIRDQACGEETVDPNCDRAARVEKPSNVDVYECVAHTPCGDDVSGCALPPSTDGEELCLSMNAKCGDKFACDQATADRYDAQFAWYKPTTLEAARACLDAKDCSGAVDCFIAWYDTVAGT